ncbi:MAG: hypothetical protein P4L84_03725 [Isosphaeraceae bacterium]|nr:hypothetical protein [Isosphaeraceae bacterium]
MSRSWKSAALSCSAVIALGLTVGSTPARAQAMASPNPWGGYATNRAAPWNAYASRPSAWSEYVYRGTASSGGGAASAPDLAPRHEAYGFRFNRTTSHWEHAGYGGKIPNYGHSAKLTELPRPWVFWGSRYY